MRAASAVRDGRAPLKDYLLQQVELIRSFMTHSI